MLLLSIETSSPSGSVALFAGERLLGLHTAWAERSHGRQVLPAVESLLSAAGKPPRDIDAVAVSAGPGMFTGLRVGLSIAKGLCRAGRARLVMVPTLEGLAENASSGGAGDLILAASDARQGELYSQFFRVGATGVVEPMDEPVAESLESLVARWPGAAVATGEGALRHAAALAEALGTRFTLAPPARRQACAAAVGRVALRMAASGLLADPVSAVPVYLRDSGARVPAALGSQADM